MSIAIDTSALVAVIFGEQDSSLYAGAMLSSAGDCMISAATLLEASIVVEAKQGPSATQDLRMLVEQIGAEIVPMDQASRSVAFAAWRRFGNGRHAAALNLGDCFSYALAKTSGAPLLYKGDDFAHTDIPSAL
jgi:ribonuclease VapC